MVCFVPTWGNRSRNSNVIYRKGHKDTCRPSGHRPRACQKPERRPPSSTDEGTSTALFEERCQIWFVPFLLLFLTNFFSFVVVLLCSSQPCGHPPSHGDNIYRIRRARRVVILGVLYCNSGCVDQRAEICSAFFASH